MKTTFTKPVIYCTTLLIFLLAACAELTNEKQISASMASADKVKRLADEDIKFLYSAFSLSLFNEHIAIEADIRSTAVETAELAKSIKETCAEVKDAVHQKAAEYSINLPADMTTEQKHLWKDLVKQKGWEFDKCFAAITDSNSTAAYQLFADAQKNSADKDVKAIAEKGLNGLKKQSDFALIQKERIKARTQDSLEADDDIIAADFKKTKRIKD